MCEFYRSTLEFMLSVSQLVDKYPKFIIQVLYMSSFRLPGQCYMYYYGGRQPEKLGNFSVVSLQPTAWNCFLRKSKQTTLVCVVLPNFYKCMLATNTVPNVSKIMYSIRCR